MSPPMSDLSRYVQHQRATNPGFRKEYDKRKALEAKAKRLEPILQRMGYETMTWFTILAVLEAAQDLDLEGGGAR